MYKKYYKRFLEANSGIQHYVSHAHQCLPDVTHEAMLAFGDDSFRLGDEKWNYILTNKVPETKKLIGNILKLSSSGQIVFASAPHELIHQLLSYFDPGKKVMVLSTDSEFDYFDGQINRSGAPKISIEKVQTFPFDNFEERFIEKIHNNAYDIIYFSHVFFNSGMAVKDISAIINAVKSAETMIIIDAARSFLVLPTDLSNLESRVLYLCDPSTQSGEGCCFLYVPPVFNHCSFQADTSDGTRSSMDFAALYRLNAVLNLFQNNNLTVEKTHAHIQKLQTNFRDHLLSLDHYFLTEKNILSVDYNHHGHFLTFAMPSAEHTRKLHEELKSHKILTDYTGSKLRFGFGLYQDDVIDLSAMKLKSNKIPKKIVPIR